MRRLSVASGVRSLSVAAILAAAIASGFGAAGCNKPEPPKSRAELLAAARLYADAYRSDKAAIEAIKRKTYDDPDLRREAGERIDLLLDAAEQARRDNDTSLCLSLAADVDAAMNIVRLVGAGAVRETDEEMVARHERSMVATQRLAALDPLNGQWQLYLAGCYVTRSFDAKTLQNDPAKSEEARQMFVETLEELVATHPEEPKWWEQLAKAMETETTRLSPNWTVPSEPALAAAMRAVGCRQRALAFDPENLQRLKGYADALALAADKAMILKHGAEAVALYEKGIDEVQQFAASHPRDPEVLRYIYKAYYNLGCLVGSEPDYVGAQKHFQRAVETLGRLRDLDLFWSTEDEHYLQRAKEMIDHYAELAITPPLTLEDLEVLGAPSPLDLETPTGR